MEWGGGHGVLYLALHCHRQNDFCIKTGSNKIHFNVQFIVRGRIRRQCPQHTPSSVFWRHPAKLCQNWLPHGRGCLYLHTAVHQRCQRPLKGFWLVRQRRWPPLRGFAQSINCGALISCQGCLMSGISRLSFDSPFLSLVFRPSPLALSVLPFFC